MSLFKSINMSMNLGSISQLDLVPVISVMVPSIHFWFDDLFALRFALCKCCLCSTLSEIIVSGCNKSNLDHSRWFISNSHGGMPVVTCGILK